MSSGGFPAQPHSPLPLPHATSKPKSPHSRRKPIFVHEGLKHHRQRPCTSPYRGPSTENRVAMMRPHVALTKPLAVLALRHAAPRRAR